jgi:hypothetical protein
VGCKSNKDRIYRLANQRKEFELRFPSAVLRDKLFHTDANDFNWAEPAAGSFASILAVHPAQQLVATGGEFIMVTRMPLTDQQQLVMWWWLCRHAGE